MDVAALEAIDCHVHAERSLTGHPSLPAHLEAAKTAYFGAPTHQPTVPEIAAYYRQRNMAAVVFTVDAESATGHEPIANEEVAESCAEHGDVLIPFASVDPWKGAAAANRVGHLVHGHGVAGFKLHPTLQAFHPNERRFYPLYEAIEAAGVPVLVHTGHTGIGAGAPGGAGIRLKYAHPMSLDDVAADFPHLTIIMAHPSFPWQDEALSVALHKPRVYIDLSGWAPKYFPPQLVSMANSLLAHKVLFGSDYPVITPDRWLADFAELDLKPEVRQRILKDNAAGVLGLG